MAKKHKKKLKSISSLKKKAWVAFARAMRQKGVQSNGKIKCITCHREYPVGDSAWNAGHYKHGKWKMSGFYENNVWPQCVFDNCGGGTNGGGDMIADIYHDALVLKLGPDEVEHIRRLSKQLWKPTRSELEGIIEKYKMQSPPSPD